MGGQFPFSCQHLGWYKHALAGKLQKEEQATIPNRFISAVRVYLMFFVRFKLISLWLVLVVDLFDVHMQLRESLPFHGCLTNRTEVPKCKRTPVVFTCLQKSI